MIDLTIAIPTYNEEKDLPVCLSAIANQEYPKDKFQVVIIDNYSSDKTLEIAKSFSKKIKIKVLKSKVKDAEFSKMIGFKNSKSKYFMYLDADMTFSSPLFIKKMLLPLEKDKRIASTFVRILVNKNHLPLTRAISYDEFQRDPIFKYFTPGISEVVVEKNKDYWICNCKNNVPAQSLMIYRKSLIEDYAKDKEQLIDNEIPAILSDNYLFAYVPEVGVYHFLLRSLPELWRKRVRNLRRTYYPNLKDRRYKWINWGKDYPKAGIWLLYTLSPLPIVNSIKKSIKYKDSCFFSEPALNLVSTGSIIYGVLSSRR